MVEGILKNYNSSKKRFSLAMYEFRICCFIDILGFKNHIDCSIDSDGNDIPAKITDVEDIINIARKILQEPHSIVNTKKVTQFSDSIIVSFRIEEKSGVFYALIDLLHIALEFAYRGYLTRGGISVGKLVHTEKHVFGPALNEAYELESKVAKFPRIILNSDILEIAKSFPLKINSSDDELESVMDCLALDDDGYYYIDYVEQAVHELNDDNYDLVPYLKSLRSTIIGGLKEEDLEVLPKFEWLKTKYNNYVSVIQKNISDWKDIDGDRDLLHEFKLLELI